MNPEKQIQTEEENLEVEEQSIEEPKGEYPDTEIMDEHQMAYQNELQNGR